MPKPPRSKAPPWLHAPLYYTIRALTAGVVAGDLAARRATAARIGRSFATSRWARRRLKRSTDNIAHAFPGWPAERVERCAVRNYEHLMMMGVETAFAPRLLTDDGWPRHLTLGDIAPGLRTLLSSTPCILITGHSGNFELLGYTMSLLGFPMHVVYRPLDLPPLDRWMAVTRQRRGMTLVDKFGALRQMAPLLRAGAPLGFIADQSGGDRGVFVPFFGRLTSTYKSIGLLAMEFGATVVCGFARRRDIAEDPRRDPGSLRCAIELIDTIRPADWADQPDPLYYITARYRRAMETMVRRAPEQYFWMHRIWRSRPRHERSGKPFPPRLAEQIRALPWTTDDDLARIINQSGRDARALAEAGTDRLP